MMSSFGLSFDVARVLGIALGAVLLVGCGGDDETPVASDSVKFVGLVSSVQGAVNSPDDVGMIFAEGSIPAEADRPKYAAYGFEVKESMIEGDSAKITVTVHDAKSWNLVGEVQWTAVKQGDDWRLKDAPLP